MPLPLMPPTSSGIASSMPGQVPPVSAAPDAGGLAALMGGSPSPAPALLDPQAQIQATAQAMQQFDAIAAQITDLARMFPGNETLVQDLIQDLQTWRSAVAVSMSPASAMVPGAQTMM